MWQEFKDFAMKGNVMDLAIAVIIGAAFGKIITSLVSDIIMPLIGLLMGRINFASLHLDVGKAVINYGAFLQSLMDFLIIALVIFLMVKAINRMHKKEEIVTPPAAPSNEEVLLAEIRDLLKSGR